MVDGQIGVVVLGEWGPRSWDFTVAIIRISRKDETAFLKLGQNQSIGLHWNKKRKEAHPNSPNKNQTEFEL